MPSLLRKFAMNRNGTETVWLLLKDNSSVKNVDLRSFLLSCTGIALTCSMRHAIKVFRD